MTGYVVNLWAAVTAEQVSTIQTNSAEIVALLSSSSSSSSVVLAGAVSLFLWAPNFMSLIFTIIHFNYIRFTFTLNFVLQWQARSLIGFFLWVQFNNQSLLRIWIQIKCFWFSFPIVRSRVKQDIRLIWIRVTVKAWVLLWFSRRGVVRTIWFSPECQTVVRKLCWFRLERSFS